MFTGKGPNEQIALSDGKIGIVIESKRYGTKLAIVNKKDAKKACQYRWSLLKGESTFYAKNNVGGFKVLHRYLLGVTDPDVKIDHKNYNGLDCRRANIRKASASQNSFNRRVGKNSTSRYTGISQRKNSWQVYISVNRKRIYLGSRGSLKAAYKIRREAEKLYYGKFA